jgi:hypothetical protein
MDMFIKTHSLSFDDLSLFIGQEQLKIELYQYQVDEIVYSWQILKNKIEHLQTIFMYDNFDLKSIVHIW